MWNKPSSEELSNLPPFYSSESTPLKEKMIYLHFFMGGSDWYAAEYDRESQTFFGFVILNGDYDNAEWGYFSFDEMDRIRITFLEIDRDLHFSPKKAIEIEAIREAQGWKEESNEPAAK